MDFYKEGAKGRCASCGFLARHSSLDPSRYEEYSRETRVLGDLWRIHASDIATEPVCIRGELNLRDSIIKEAEAIPAELDDAWEVATRNILQEDRDCPKWFVYQPSLTPAMHLQAYDQFRLEEERRDWEEQVEQERRTFEEHLDERNREFLKGLEEQRRDWEKKTNAWPNRLIWAALILAIGEVLGTFLSLPAIARLLGFG